MPRAVALALLVAGCGGYSTHEISLADLRGSALTLSGRVYQGTASAGGSIALPNRPRDCAVLTGDVRATAGGYMLFVPSQGGVVQTGTGESPQESCVESLDFYFYPDASTRQATSTFTVTDGRTTIAADADVTTARAVSLLQPADAVIRSATTIALAWTPADDETTAIDFSARVLISPWFLAEPRLAGGTLRLAVPAPPATASGTNVMDVNVSMKLPVRRCEGVARCDARYGLAASYRMVVQ